MAARAGVSHQTVSRVINRSERVSAETQQRVESAIAELGFRPDMIARAMAWGRSFTLACLAPNLTDYTFSRIIEAAEATARQAGYLLLTSSAPDETAFRELVEHLVDNRRVEGLMVINPYVDGRSRHLPAGLPVTLVGSYARSEAFHSVNLDNTMAGYQAARHLIELGHRRIALITGPLNEDCSVDRQAGFETALRDAGLPVRPDWICQGDWTAASSYRFFQSLPRADLPSAVFAQNDRMAIGIIRAARDWGLAVPDDLSVLGFDDMPLASYFDPPLTTIQQDMFLIGREAARLLLGAVEQPDAERKHVVIPARLILRRSTAPFRERR